MAGGENSRLGGQLKICENMHVRRPLEFPSHRRDNGTLILGVWNRTRAVLGCNQNARKFYCGILEAAERSMVR